MDNTLDLSYPGNMKRTAYQLATGFLCLGEGEGIIGPLPLESRIADLLLGKSLPGRLASFNSSEERLACPIDSDRDIL